jgi:serine/threonine protein phosphatase PrpC
MPSIAAAAHSVPGLKRKSNEDAHRIFLDQEAVTNSSRPALFAVADGMGSYTKGAEAATMAVDHLAQFFSLEADAYQGEHSLQELFFKANIAVTRLRNQSRANYGMGTTLTCLMLDAATLDAVLLYVGDSAAWLLRDKELLRLTIPHVDQTGAITQHIGMGPGMKLDRVRLRLTPGDRLLLCSDGVDTQVPARMMQSVLAEALAPEAAAQALTSLADKLGGKDNATAVVVFVGEATQ